MLTAKEIIELYDMQPLIPEGGFFKVFDVSDIIIKKESIPKKYICDKPICGTILYMITNESFSRMHFLPTDEIYHFYMGDSVEQLQLLKDGTGCCVKMGQDIANGELIQSKAPANCWHGTKIAKGGKHGYALLGTTMAPGYTPDDYVDGVREELIRKYPMFKNEIVTYTPNH